MPTSPRASAIPEESPWLSPFQAAAAQRPATEVPHRRPGADGEQNAPSTADEHLTSASSNPLNPSDKLTPLAGPSSALQRPSAPVPSSSASATLARASQATARSSGEVWNFAPGTGRRSAREVRRMSMDGERLASATRPRRTLEDVLIRVPSPTVDEVQDPDPTGRLSVPSATTQDVNDLLAIRAARERRSSRSFPPITRQSAGPRMQEGESAGETRRTSNPYTANLRELVSAQDGIAGHERGAFGTSGLGWAMLMPTNADPARVVQRNLAVYAEESDNGQSWWPLIKMAPTFAGKMSVAIGADVLTLGLSTQRGDLIAGGTVAVAGGIVTVMLGMQALCVDMLKINPRRVPFTLVFSLLGMVLISAAVVVSETDLGSESLAIRSVSALVFGIGLTMLNTSLPLSFAYSEMVHGDTFRDYRNEVAFVMWGIGLGLATGLTVSRSAPRQNVMPVTYPFGVTHAFAVFGIACATFGTCLVATNLQRQTGRLLALRTRLRQLAAEARQEHSSPRARGDAQV